jgi:hypothetical protein
MDPIKYRLKLYTLRSQLQDNGILQPVNEMVKLGILKKDTKNWDYLLGRVLNEEFLEKLENFTIKTCTTK